MPSYKKFNCIAFAAAALVPVLAFAAQPDAGQLLNEQQQMQQRRLERSPQEEGKRIERPPIPREADRVTVRLQAVRFSGDVGIVGESQLQALVKDALGKTLDFNGLQDLADKVTAYLKGKGYFLAHAYLPKQYLTGGMVEIVLLAGRLQSVDDAIVIQGQVRIAPERLKWIAKGAAQPGEVVRQAELERAVLLINDLPGVTAVSNVERGSEAGTVRLVVDANEGPLLAGEAWLDDYGNRYTGEWRGNARFDVNDPLHIGDRLSLSLSAAADLHWEQIHYAWPIDNSGMRAAVSYGNMGYVIGKDLSDLNASGTSTIMGAAVSYPFIRTRFHSLWGSVNYADKSLQDDAFGVSMRNRRINVWSGSLTADSYDRLSGGGLNNLGVTVTGGTLDLAKVPTDLALDRSSGANTNGSYAKISYSLARLQSISGRLSLFGALNGQFASKNLDSSEKFILGGPQGVRAYPVGEGAGDQGFLSNIELRYELPTAISLGHLQGMVFVDAGKISLHKSPWPGSVATNSSDNHYMIYGAGLGLNLTKPGSYAVRAAWATKIGSNPGRSLSDTDSDGQRDDSRFWLYGVVWI